MIYTVTFNPALDYTISLDRLFHGQVNRTRREQIFPGGKGLNVSLMLRRLGVDSTALGFCAGFTGRELVRLMESSGCRTELIPLPEGATRINVKLKAEQETDINGQGPPIPPQALETLWEKLLPIGSQTKGEPDYLVLAGSIPDTLPADIYEKILARLAGKQVRCVVDATGSLLRRTLPYRPFLIKPNREELSALFDRDLKTVGDLLEGAAALQKEGARNVLVSMAGEGALLLNETGKVHQSPAPFGKAVNSVGAGDSMVAGFLAGFLESGGSYLHAFRMGLCAGSASAFQEWLASRAEVEALLRQMENCSL